MLFIQPRVLVPKQCVLIDIFHGNVIHENFSASTKPKSCDRHGHKLLEVGESDENWVVTLTEAVGICPPVKSTVPGWGDMYE